MSILGILCFVGPSHRVIILNRGIMFAILEKRIFPAVKLSPQTPPIDKREIEDAAIPGERRIYTSPSAQKTRAISQ